MREDELRDWRHITAFRMQEGMKVPFQRSDGNPFITPEHPVTRPLDEARVKSPPSPQYSLDFCMWVQASFDDLVEEINKGMKTFSAKAGK